MASTKKENNIKDSKKNESNKNIKLTDRQKEIILTVCVIVSSIIIGSVVGYLLFEAMHK